MKPSKRGNPIVKSLWKDDDEFDFQKDLQIDPDNLDTELLMHGNIAFKWNKLAAEAKLKLSEAENSLVITKSKVIKEIKKGGGDYTVKELEAEYRTDPRYQQAVKKRNRAEYESSVLEAARFALKDRKDSLNDLVKLALMQYFDTPDGGRDLRQQLMKHEKTKSVNFINKISDNIKGDFQ